MNYRHCQTLMSHSVFGFRVQSISSYSRWFCRPQSLKITITLVQRTRLTSLEYVLDSNLRNLTLTPLIKSLGPTQSTYLFAAIYCESWISTLLSPVVDHNHGESVAKSLRSPRCKHSYPKLPRMSV
jgi:hypothetical protein